MRTTTKKSTSLDLVYPSPKASAFYQNIQRIFEIYKGNIFPREFLILFVRINYCVYGYYGNLAIMAMLEILR